MKRTIALLLSLVFVFAFTACTGSDSTPSSTAAATKADSASDETEASKNGVEEEKEIYEITVTPQTVHRESSELTEIGQYIKERFGLVIKMSSYQGDGQELQMLQLASGDYAEVQRLEYDRVYREYVDRGVLMSLDPYLDQMPDFQRVFADAIPLWRLTANGDLLKWDVNVPKQGETDIECNDMLVRSDVLEYYDWPTPVSEDEWVDFLKQALIDFPETNGMKTLGVVVPFAESWGLSSLATINFEKGDAFTELNNADGGVLFDMNKDTFVDYFKEPSVKECFAFFNRLYREGILDVESMTDLCDNVDEKCDSGSAIAVYYMIWNRDRYNMALINSGNEDMQYVALPLQGNSHVASGQKRAIRVEDTRSFNSWAITDKCKEPERVIEFVNWACSDEGQIILQGGLEGKHWTRSADGKRELTDEFMQNFTNQEYIYDIGINGVTCPFAPDFVLPLGDGQFPSARSTM